MSCSPAVSDGTHEAVCACRIMRARHSSANKKKKNCTIKPAHAVPLASARQGPENQKENQAGHSSERTVEGQTAARTAKLFPALVAVATWQLPPPPVGLWAVGW